MVRPREAQGVEGAFGIGVGEDQFPGGAAVGGLVEAGEWATAGGHDDGGVGVEGLDAAEVELLRIGRRGAPLPTLAIVHGTQDSAIGAGGPGDSVAERVDSSQVGGSRRGLHLPLSVGGGCRKEDAENKCVAHRRKCIPTTPISGLPSAACRCGRGGRRQREARARSSCGRRQRVRAAQGWGGGHASCGRRR